MIWLRAIQGVIGGETTVLLFHLIDKGLHPWIVVVATFRCAETSAVFGNLMAVCRKLCFLVNLSVFVIRRSPPGCLSFSLIFIWKTEPNRPAEWNCLLLALKSVSRISPANIILIHVRPAEIYCWNCNMLDFFAPSFWKNEVCKLPLLQISHLFFIHSVVP